MASGRQAVLMAAFREDLGYWVRNDRKLALRLLSLVEAVMRDPFIGIGKPEPLKDKYAGCWSRRLNQEHRLIYRLIGDRVEFLKARDHY